MTNIFSKTSFKDKRLYLGIVVAGLVFASFFTYFYRGQEEQGLSKVLATVGKEKITQKDFNERVYGFNFTGTPENPSYQPSDDEKSQILDKLVEHSACHLEGSSKNITVSQAELDSLRKERVPDFDSYNDDQKTLSNESLRNEALCQKLADKAVAWREGAYILVRFDQALQDNLKDGQKKYEEDKTYAATLAKRIYTDITSGKITFEEGMKQADEDPRTGKSAWLKPDNYVFSRVFTKEDSIESGVLAASPDFWEKIYKLEKGKIKEPFAVSLNFDEEGTTKEAMYVIAKVDDSQDGERTYDEWLTKLLEKYKVKVK